MLYCLVSLMCALDVLYCCFNFVAGIFWYGKSVRQSYRDYVDVKVYESFVQIVLL